MTAQMGTGSHLNRTSGGLPSLAGYTICGWVLTDLPSDDWATVVYLVVPGNDAHCTIHTNQSGDVLNWRYSYGDTTFTNAIPHGEWFWCGLRFDDEENVTVLVYRPGQDEGVVELGTAEIGPRYKDPLEGLWLGDDIWSEPVGSNTNPGLFRAWRIVPNSADLDLERASLTAVATPIAEWPLDEDANDVSGNGYHLTEQGSNLAWVAQEPPIGDDPEPPDAVVAASVSEGGGYATSAATPVAVALSAGEGGGFAQAEGTPIAGLSSASSGGGHTATEGTPVIAASSAADGGGYGVAVVDAVAAASGASEGGGFAEAQAAPVVLGEGRAEGGGEAAAQAVPTALSASSFEGGGHLLTAGTPIASAASSSSGGGTLATQAVPAAVAASAVEGGGFSQVSGTPVTLAETTGQGGGASAAEGTPLVVGESHAEGGGYGFATTGATAARVSSAAVGGGFSGAQATPTVTGEAVVGGGGYATMAARPVVLAASSAEGGGFAFATTGFSAVGVSSHVAGGGVSSAAGSPVAVGSLSALGGGYSEAEVAPVAAMHSLLGGGGEAEAEATPVVSVTSVAVGGGHSSATDAQAVWVTSAALGGGFGYAEASSVAVALAASMGAGISAAEISSYVLGESTSQGGGIAHARVSSTVVARVAFTGGGRSFATDATSDGPVPPPPEPWVPAKPPMIAIRLKNLRVTSLDVDFHEVSWAVDSLYEDVLDYRFQVLRSESPEGPYDVLTEPFEDRYSFIDNILHIAHSWRTYFYKIRIIEKATGYHEDTGPVAHLPEPDIITNEVRRHIRLLMREFAGRRCVVLPLRTFGQRCPECWVPSLKKRNKSGCLTCYDTGFVRGYLHPIETFIQVDPSTKSKQPMTVGTTQQQNTTIRLGYYPPVKPDDIIVELENIRWRVHTVTQTEHSRAAVHQEVTVHRINEKDIEYAIPVHFQDALPNLYVTPARNFTNPQNLETVTGQEVADIFALYPSTHPRQR